MKAEIFFRSYQTTTTSTTAGSDTPTPDQLVIPAPIIKPRNIGPSVNRKKKAKKAKKTKKNKNGPKITVEEVQAIKKKKKEDADREFEKLDKEKRERLEKVATSDRHKIFRKVVQTALDIVHENSSKLPIEIQQLDNDLEFYVNNSEETKRVMLRDLYLQTRVMEVSRMYLGEELISKIELLTAFQEQIERSIRLFQYFMFLASLDDDSPHFYEFEVMTISYYFIGYEENRVPHEDSSELELNFFYFVADILRNIPETDQFVNTVSYVRNKLMIFAELDATISLTKDEMILREAYMGIGHVLKEYKTLTNVCSFLQTHKENMAYNLMEAWFLESRKPVPYVFEI